MSNPLDPFFPSSLEIEPGASLMLISPQPQSLKLIFSQLLLDMHMRDVRSSYLRLLLSFSLFLLFLSVLHLICGLFRTS